MRSRFAFRPKIRYNSSMFWRIGSSGTHAIVTLIVMIALTCSQLVLGSSGASALGDPCVGTCPCEEGSDAEQDAAPTHDPSDGHESRALDHDPGSDEGPQDEDSCPDDCPDCRCAVGIALAIVPSLSIPAFFESSSSVESSTMAMPPAGLRVDVFRPPRPRV